MPRTASRPQPISRGLGAPSAALAIALASLVVPVLSPPVVDSASAVSAPAAPRAAERNLTATAQDLGTLGGKHSRAEAIEGSVVVGWSNDAQRKRHAFAYDLAADDPTMIDLGTLGGNTSYASAVAGSVVVGISQTVPGEAHAFAYDLASDEPTMIDLGVLEGGKVSEAVDVDGRFVVGDSTVPSDDPYDSHQQHAFVYDLEAAEPVMRDLGTLGGGGSFAKAVDGSVITGGSHTPDGPEHAFAYDPAADEPTMIDLGTLPGGSFSEAVDVSDGVVAGWSYAAGANKRRAFTFDLAAAEPAMREHPTIGGARSAATGIAGNLVIQEWRKRGDHAFVHDLGSGDSRSISLGNWRGSDAVGVDGDVVVGVDSYGSASRATAWTVRQTTRPMVAFRRLDQGVKENVGRVRIQVVRYGRTNRAVSVRYRTRSDSAKAGKDFVATSGKLRFAKGVTRRSFTVRIKNDRRQERAEYLVLTLSRPSGPAVLGTPHWSNLRINKSDG